jgi:predicted AlkP superfamily phosphohydrolase/phosphomutase
MQKSNRVMIIGLDGATWDALDPWIKDGSLPNLAKLRQSGSWGALLSSIPPITPAAWSTFMTGKRPGKHGVFHFIKLFEDNSFSDGKPELVNARSLRSSTLWDIMGHNGRQVVLINVPMTYPPRPVNGVMITGLLTPKNASVFTYPPELSKEITDYQIDLDRFIDKKPFQDDFDPEVTAPTLSLVEEFRDMLEKRARVSFSLMESNSWDCFMVVFTGTDRMGHYLWPYHHSHRDANLSGQMYDGPEVQQLHQAVHSYYIRLDEIVGELVEKAGEEVTVIVMSDHGMGPAHSKWVHCNNWLQQQGWLVSKSSDAGVASPDGWLKRLGLPRDKVGRIIRQIPGLAGSHLLRKASSTRSATVDVNRSKAYCVPIFFNIMGVRINLEGEEKEALRQQIMQGLKEIVDPETGQGVVQQVCRGEDYYYGPYADNIPDIIAIVAPEYGYSYHLSRYSAIVTKRQTVSGPAKHRLEGIFIANGSNIASRSEPLPSLNIEDIAPTVLHIMRLPVPTDMDGRVLTEVIAPDFLGAQPVRRGEPIGFWPEEGEVTFSDEVMSDADEELIRDRLQALGYFE